MFFKKNQNTLSLFVILQNSILSGLKMFREEEEIHFKFHKMMMFFITSIFSYTFPNINTGFQPCHCVPQSLTAWC